MDPDAVEEIIRVETGSAGGKPGGVSSSDRVPHGGQPDPLLLDFSANTNPKTPTGVSRVYEAALSAARSYPDDCYYEFRATAAEYTGCEAPQVVPTAGGIEGVRLAVGTTVDRGQEVLLPAPSFGAFAREVRMQGGDPSFVAHDAVLETDPSPYAMVIVGMPNNPTGEAYDPEALSAYAERCRETDTVLLVNESFLGFTDLPSMAGQEGVIAVRSLTKLFGLPGLRAGFAVATGDHLDRLELARQTWNLSTPAAAVGTHCLRQTEFVAETRERTAAERQRMRESLAEHFEVHPSDAPFLLLDTGASDRVDELLETVREHDLAIRDARTFRGLDQHVRVSVRLPYENDILLDVLGRQP
jgi:histidinol-phosphate aminotransferase/threonine-phosphate decarboxylase